MHYAVKYCIYKLWTMCLFVNNEVRFSCSNLLMIARLYLTRAPLGYFYNAPHWGGGAISSPPPLWSPKLLDRFWKFKRHLKALEKLSKENKFYWPRGHEWRHRSGQSQNVRHFGIGDIGEQNCDVKHKQSQLIGMDSVSDICKYHLLCFMTIIEVKVMSGHQAKKVNQKKFAI